MVKMTSIEHRVSGIILCSEERKLMWMHETRIRLFTQMALEACRDKYNSLLRFHHCAVNNCPEEYCPHRLLPIPRHYVKNLVEIWETVRKGILPPPLKKFIKTRHPLSPQQRPPPISPPPHIPLCPSTLPDAEPESSGNVEIKSDSLEALVDGQEDERWEVSLVARPEDTVGKHQERREIPPLKVLEKERMEGKMEPKREFPTLESTLAGTGVEAPGQLCLPSRELGVTFFV